MVVYVVSVVVAVTMGVMHVLLFVLHVRVTTILVWVRRRCSGGECVYGWYTCFRCFV